MAQSGRGAPGYAGPAPLAAGTFVIVYLLTRDIRHVSFGLPLVLAGYAVEFVGLVKDIRPGA